MAAEFTQKSINGTLNDLTTCFDIVEKFNASCGIRLQEIIYYSREIKVVKIIVFNEKLNRKYIVWLIIKKGCIRIGF